MFVFEFMRRAFICGVLIAVMIPFIGVVMVNRRTAMIGDALSHTSLAGVAIGLILGFDPIIGATLICIVSALSIERIRKIFPQYGDMATAVVMSIGLGLAGILSNFSASGNTFESYLFGSISSVTVSDLRLVIIAFFLVIAFSIVYYNALMDIAIDVHLARLAGVNVAWINVAFTILTAITVALSARVVGALLVSSLMVLPVATALMISRSYKQTVIISIGLSLIDMLVGLTMSFYWNFKPGGAIILVAVTAMLCVSSFGYIRKKLML